MRLALIGTGRMGTPIAARLREAGHQLVVYDLEAARPILEAFASRIYHAGPLGSGHAVKALNNALSAVALSATSEAVAIGRYAGHRPEGVVKRLNAGIGRTQNSEVKFPRD